MFKLIALLSLLSTLLVLATPIEASITNVENIQENSVAHDLNKPATNKAFTFININNASINELSLGLKSIGKVKAKAIVDYRTKNGEFKNFEDLLKVKGVGKKTLMKNKQYIRFEGNSTI